MKLCKNCRHYDGALVCRRDVTTYKNVVTGCTTYEGFVCCDRKNQNDGCGPDGQFYDAPHNIGERVALWIRRILR